MKVRGERECTDCGTRWSYYDTGEVACPDCGSLRSVGVERERRRHTDAPATLDLTRFREAVADAEPTRGTDADLEGIDEIAADLGSTLREYLRKRGFIRGGELLELDDTYLAARELLEVVDAYRRLREPDEAASLYVLELLEGADDGERPGTDAVPAQLAPARGLAVATVVEAYRDELVTYLGDLEEGAAFGGDTSAEEVADATDATDDTDVTTVLGKLRDRTKRVRALEGDVDPAEAETLVDAAREIGAYLREDDLDALARAHDRLADVV
ncbi:hypothetical protein AArcSl_2761 [Halalkaliarchaeum desulfuricum]|uniref:TFIIB-type zinc ribbon-containing protein n=1 Tax=Halalkaliarchaeum desulfuricum TaxID=2055893 RepID=A0A343TMQ4_9EURY|nr:hypothetical protein [Halalkaliarchaeum desulfuricum]AUX10376.1 hypothetical protein AArcSl_2761 [Halalkaliarchaeum desulfuricum]